MLAKFWGPPGRCGQCLSIGREVLTTTTSELRPVRMLETRIGGQHLGWYEGSLGLTGEMDGRSLVMVASLVRRLRTPASRSYISSRLVLALSIFTCPTPLLQGLDGKESTHRRYSTPSNYTHHQQTLSPLLSNSVSNRANLFSIKLASWRQNFCRWQGVRQPSASIGFRSQPRQHHSNAFCGCSLRTSPGTRSKGLYDEIR